MSEIDLNNFFYSSGQLFSYLQQNKNLLTVFLEDGTKLSGRLLGWDADYLVILYGKTIQIVPIKKLLRLQAEMDNASVSEPDVIQAPELPKPKAAPTPMKVINEQKEQIAVEKAQDSNKDTPPKDRLDSLVRNW